MNARRTVVWALAGLFALVVSRPVELPAQETNQAEKVLRAGIIGLDTSHVVAFTQLLNNRGAKGPLARVRVVAGYPGGSPDLPASRDRVDKFTETLRGMGVEIVPSIPELLRRVDVVLLESVDGRVHLKQAVPVFRARKPVFIDKPLAASLAEAVAIARLAQKYNVPCFSSSSLRFSPGILGFRMQNDQVGQVMGCVAYGPCPIEPTHPDLFWYGVHGVETLFTIMGPGCVEVTRVYTPKADVVVGRWRDGRLGTFRGIRHGRRSYGAFVFGTKQNMPAGSYAGYKPLVEEIARFFLTGKAPVAMDETLEIFAFMQAAQLSRQRGGQPVKIEEVMQQAQREADRLLEQLGEK